MTKSNVFSFTFMTSVLTGSGRFRFPKWSGDRPHVSLKDRPDATTRSEVIEFSINHLRRWFFFATLPTILVSASKIGANVPRMYCHKDIFCKKLPLRIKRFRPCPLQSGFNEAGKSWPCIRPRQLWGECDPNFIYCRVKFIRNFARLCTVLTLHCFLEKHFLWLVLDCVTLLGDRPTQKKWSELKWNIIR